MQGTNHNNNEEMQLLKREYMPGEGELSDPEELLQV